jgi:twitching motility protein PilT
MTPAAQTAKTRSQQVSSTDLARDFGTIDQFGEDPSIERSVSVSVKLPRESEALVDTLLMKAKAERASDVHFAPGRAPMARTGGELKAIGTPVDQAFVDGLADMLLPPPSAPVLRREGSAIFSVETRSAGRARVHVARAGGARHVSLRFIPEVSTLGALELPEAAITLGRTPHGLALVTSPKGHGGSTTLAAIVDAINESVARRIVIIDSPIEFVHAKKRSLVTHIEVGVHAASYASAVASAVRADADVVVIGDIRDVSTMRIALSAAEEGRLVVGTLNARSCARALERFVESFPAPEQALARASLSSTIRLVLGQRLVPSVDRTKLHCAQEVLPASVALYTIIRDAKWTSMPALMQKGKPLGVVRLEEALADLVREGAIPVDLARPLALVPQDFDALASGGRPGKKG